VRPRYRFLVDIGEVGFGGVIESARVQDRRNCTWCSHGVDERLRNRLEDVVSVVRGEIHGSIDLEHDLPTGSVREQVDSGKVEQAANDAAPKSEQEAREMQEAERIGKQHVKGEDPAVRNPKKKQP